MIEGHQITTPKTTWEMQRDKEKKFDEQVRDLMNRRRITYQEAEQMLKVGQKGLFDFR